MSYALCVCVWRAVHSPQCVISSIHLSFSNQQSARTHPAIISSVLWAIPFTSNFEMLFRSLQAALDACTRLIWNNLIYANTYFIAQRLNWTRVRASNSFSIFQWKDFPSSAMRVQTIKSGHSPIKMLEIIKLDDVRWTSSIMHANCSSLIVTSLSLINQTTEQPRARVSSSGKLDNVTFTFIFIVIIANDTNDQSTHTRAHRTHAYIIATYVRAIYVLPVDDDDIN